MSAPSAFENSTPLHLLSVVEARFVPAIVRSVPGARRTDAYSLRNRIDTRGLYDVFLLWPFSHQPSFRILGLWSFRFTSCTVWEQLQFRG